MRFVKQLAVLCVTLCVFFTGMQSAANVAFAEDKTATEVLDDLSRDKSFNPDNYPTKTDDYSLQIIQLAESTDKELFVYVYQPSGKTKDFKASSIVEQYKLFLESIDKEKYADKIKKLP